MKDFSKNLSVLRPFFRGLPIIILVMVIAVLMVKRYLRYTTPMYESTAKIKLADARDGVPNSNLFKDFDVFTTSNKIAGEVELLKSKVLVEKAVAGLGIDITIYRVGEIHKTELYHESPFLVKADIQNPKLLDKPFSVVVSSDSMVTIVSPLGTTAKGKMGSILNIDGSAFAFILNQPLIASKKGLKVNDKYEFTCHSTQAMVDGVIANLDVMSVDKEVPVLRINYKSPVAKKSADIVNALAAAYITDYINEKYKSADTTVDFLQRQLNTMNGRLSASENSIEAYRDNNNIINIKQETETDLRKIADLKKQQASVQMNLLAMKDLNSYLAKGKDNFEELAPNFEAFTDLLSTELVKKVKELQREKRDLLIRYTPDNEKVKVVDDKIGDINVYLLESIRNTERNLQVKYDDLSNTISKAEEVFIGLPTKEKTMTIMERNFSLNEQIYRFLHEKRTEAEIARAATMSFHRIIGAGEIPLKPVSPNPTLLITLAGFLGFLFGVAGVYTIHFMKARISDAELIQKNSDTPVIAEVPFLKSATQKELFFRRWTIELDLKKHLEKGAVVVVSSFDAKEGKRYNVTGIAAALAAIGKTCVVVDADGTMAPGSFQHIITPDGFGANWQIQSNWKTMIGSLHAAYDVVLVKNTAVSTDPVSLMIMANATFNLFVLDTRRTKSKMIMQADLMKEQLQLPEMHFVLNRDGYTPSIFRSLHGIIPSFRSKA